MKRHARYSTFSMDVVGTTEHNQWVKMAKDVHVNRNISIKFYELIDWIKPVYNQIYYSRIILGIIGHKDENN